MRSPDHLAATDASSKSSTSEPKTVIPISDIVNYEVRSAWWTPLIASDYLQELSGRYFAWKTRRKYRRYQSSIDFYNRLVAKHRP